MVRTIVSVQAAAAQKITSIANDSQDINVSCLAQNKYSGKWTMVIKGDKEKVAALVEAADNHKVDQSHPTSNQRRILINNGIMCSGMNRAAAAHCIKKMGI